MSGKLPIHNPISLSLITDVTQLQPTTRAARARFSVALVSMPVIASDQPSIQLGLLKAIGESFGFPVQTLHLHLDFAHQVGAKMNEVLAGFGRSLIGDWLFAGAAFGEVVLPSRQQYVDEHKELLTDLCKALGDKSTEELFRLRDEEVPRYLDHVLETTDWGSFRVVGFTSTFQQNLASFALAARIKQRFPHVITLFGGANFEGDMGRELVRAVPCVDYAVLGEADEAFPELLVALQEGRSPLTIPGVCGKTEAGASVAGFRPPLENMDVLPIPAYEEYFERAERLGIIKPTPRRSVRIPFESARGCWWGAKHHCTFCGLNGGSIRFRSKSAERTRQQLAEMARRYRSFHFAAVDNILDSQYLQSLLPRLVQDAGDLEFFYEVKSNLTRAQLRQLRAAGVTQIQPGIESLSTHVLSLMRKGVTAIQNVNTLRWSRYHGIGVGWNLLYGFPGETEQDYLEQQRVLPFLMHLQPPGGAGRIWMERFSPLFVEREKFPAHYVRPIQAYRHLYPAEVDCEQIAYFFDYQLHDVLREEAYAGFLGAVEKWKQAWQIQSSAEAGATKDSQRRPELRFFYAPGFLQIEDTREPIQPGTYTFESPLAEIYVSCSDRPQTSARLRELLKLPWPESDIDEALDEFAARGLMLRAGNQALSLALPATPGR